MTDAVDVAIVGAGPYGLSVAAHLNRTKLSRRVIGRPMELWRSHMPRGMYLKSPVEASSLSDPMAFHSLDQYCRSSDLRPFEFDWPIPVETFTEYGDWFQRNEAPDVDQSLITRIARENSGFALTTDGGESVRARAVVIAVGMQHFARMPTALSRLPESLVSHSSAHANFERFRGRDVIVVGAGQSALESAALLYEIGAHVRLMARTRRLVWNSEPALPHRPLLKRMLLPDAPLGPGWGHWVYSYHPEVFRHMSGSFRLNHGYGALGPAGAWWLRSRIVGRVDVLLGHTPVEARLTDSGVQLTAAVDGRTVQLEAEHVISGTGYRPDLSRLDFIDEALRARIRTFAAAPLVDRHFESTVPGLHFVGAAVATSFGPSMRFVCGADYAARTVAHRLVESAR